jgi:hypothetical protein
MFKPSDKEIKSLILILLLVDFTLAALMLQPSLRLLLLVLYFYVKHERLLIAIHP